MKSTISTNVNLIKAVAFLKEIGIAVDYGSIEGESFLPGVSIVNGSIIIDEEKFLYPGDILHEAGHIAVVPASERATLNEHDIAERPQREAEEMMAIAWSYAACVHLEIDAVFVFHDDGYKGGGSDLAENFKQGHYFGVPMLQWVSMALEKKNATEQNMPYYPQMLRWLRA